MNKHFWKWVKNQAEDDDTEAERKLFLDGVISETTWFEDDITPAMFKEELDEGTGPITVWINSPGGDVIAAAQIYNMLSQYPGKVTVMIDGLAASAASVVAMAGDDIVMSPVSMLMIHNPSMMAYGDHADFEKAIEVLDEVKESIINAYVEKTHLSRNKISKLMDEETWMNARKALELGFANSILGRISDDSGYMAVDPLPRNSILFSRKWEDKDFFKKLKESIPEPEMKELPIECDVDDVLEEEELFEDLETTPNGRPVSEIMERLSIIKNYI